jgi:hypothetical protein
MAKGDLSQTINTLANVGVLAGIIFLAIEVSQNQASLEQANAFNLVSARDSTLQDFIDFRESIFQNEALAQIKLNGDAGEQLSQVDAARYSMMCRNQIFIFAVGYERASALNPESGQAAAVQGLSGLIADNPGLRTCWDSDKVSISAWGIENFVDAVDSALQ